MKRFLGVMVLVFLILGLCAGQVFGQKEKPKNPPNRLDAVAVSSSQINLYWEDRSDNEESFEIWRKSDPGGFDENVGTVAKNTTFFQDSGLLPDTRYKYKVRAINSYGYSGWSNEAHVTTLSDHKNQIPVPVCEVSSREGRPPFLVLFDGSKSYDPDGSIVKWEWDFGDHSAGGEGVRFYYTYTKTGVYHPTLTVTDNEGAQAQVACCTIVVSEEPPRIPECDVKLVKFITSVIEYQEGSQKKYNALVEWQIEKELPDGHWLLLKSFGGTEEIKTITIPAIRFWADKKSFSWTDIDIPAGKKIYYILKWVCDDDKCRIWGPVFTEVIKK